MGLRRRRRAAREHAVRRGAELRIAAAGPAVSLVLAIACLGAAIALPLLAEIDGVAFWLGQINRSLLL